MNAATTVPITMLSRTAICDMKPRNNRLIKTSLVRTWCSLLLSSAEVGDPGQV
jgi:hypothetical protein